MNQFDHIEVKMNAVGQGKVLLNGVPLKGVRGVSVNGEFGGPTEVTITLIANVNCDQ